jgi:hypothetical protein
MLCFLIDNLLFLILQEERVMAFFCRMDTITIFHDSEISMDAKEWFGCTVLLKVPTTANQDRINRILIHHAIVNICGVNVALENILRHDPDYLVWGSSTDQATEILRTPKIDIGAQRLSRIHGLPSMVVQYYPSMACHPHP